MSFETIRRQAQPDLFPRDRLEGCETGLVLFAAGFYGRQDAVWLKEAGLRCDCVDIRPEGLSVMQTIYPSDWSFMCVDVFTYMQRAAAVWDVVTVDCPTNLFEKCADWLPIFCGVARRLVVLGTGLDTVVVPPLGWRKAERIHRSNFVGGVYWDVFEKE